MKNNYPKVGAYIYLLFSGLNISTGQPRLQPAVLEVVFTDNSGYFYESVDSVYLIKGQVKTEDLQPVEKVAITLTSPGHVYPAYITAKDGNFNFNVPPGEYTINAERNDNHRNGVSSLDLIRIQKHLLGTEPFTSPYKLIAADANNSQSVSAIDLIEIRKLILGKYTEFPSNKSWRFVAKKSININLTSDSYDNDFVGIKIGDVNNSVKANIQDIHNRSVNPSAHWIADQKEYSAGDLVEINFYLKDPTNLQGFQFTITDPDLEFLDASSSGIHLGPEDFALFHDKITMSWFDEKGIQTSPKDVVFTLKARAKSKGYLWNNLSINSDITEAEMYNMENVIFIPRLLNEDKFNPIISSFPEPNPWKDESNITFYLSYFGTATLDIYDLNGRVIFTQTESFNMGKNVIRIHSTDFPERGLLFYTIKTDDNVISNKMIVIN